MVHLDGSVGMHECVVESVGIVGCESQVCADLIEAGLDQRN